MINTIIHGDCVDVLPGIKDGSMDLVIADPPYNVYASGAGGTPMQRRNKDVPWDVLNPGFIDFSMTWIGECSRVLKDTGSLFVFGGVNYTGGDDFFSLLPLARQKLILVNVIAWIAPNGTGSERFFSNRIEWIAWLVKTRDYTFHLDNVRVSLSRQEYLAYARDKRLNKDKLKAGINPTNAWFFERVSPRSREATGHPTQKPEALIERIINATTERGDIVLDPFTGSGTTCAVAKRLGRKWIGVEMDAAYHAIATRRVDASLVATRLDDHVR